jgi:hypothetical protein
MIVDGLSILYHTHPAFGIFQLNADMPHHGVEIIDPQHWNRKGGDKYFVVAGSPIEMHPSFSTMTMLTPEVIDTK